MKQIVSVLNDENKAYVDLRDGHKNILFVFQDEMNDAKINLIPIEVRRVIHKFKQSNYIITLDKADRQKIQEMIDAGFIRKIK